MGDGMGNLDEIMELIGRLEAAGKTVRIHKFASTTNMGDTVLRTKGNEYQKFEALGNNTWRVRVGNSGEWVYGTTMLDAIRCALKQGEEHEQV